MPKAIQHATADVFTAIAHPIRRQILDTLAGGAVSVTALAAPFTISRAAISQHLAILLETGLVGREKRGREQVYHLNATQLAEVHRWVSRYTQFWQDKLAALDAYLSHTDGEERHKP